MHQHIYIYVYIFTNMCIYIYTNCFTKEHSDNMMFAFLNIPAEIPWSEPAALYLPLLIIQDRTYLHESANSNRFCQLSANIWCQQFWQVRWTLLLKSTICDSFSHTFSYPSHCIPHLKQVANPFIPSGTHNIAGKSTIHIHDVFIKQIHLY